MGEKQTPNLVTTFAKASAFAETTDATRRRVKKACASRGKIWAPEWLTRHAAAFAPRPQGCNRFNGLTL
jgi:hypothetical protein